MGPDHFAIYGGHQDIGWSHLVTACGGAQVGVKGTKAREIVSPRKIIER